MTVSATTDCEGCGHQIGEKATETGVVMVNDHVTCWDGIKNKPVTFHKRCHQLGLSEASRDPNVQRRHAIGLAPARLGLTLKGLN